MPDSNVQPLRPKPKPIQIYFGLLPGYSLLTVSGAIEVLNFANEYVGQEAFQWTICSETGDPVPDRTGLGLPVDGPFPSVSDRDIVLVCAGEKVNETCSTPLLNWVRKSARFGAALGGLDTGSKVLARAGVLNGVATTIHWKNRVTFFEEHPDEVLTGDVYTAERGRYATAGGTASIDLALHLVSEICGEDIAHQIAVRMNYTNIRVLQSSEKIQAADQVGFRHPKLSIILSLMETNLEEPLRPTDLARSVNISARQLERLFRRYLKSTPSAYYTRMRLEHARNLLLQSDMYIADVAVACGFGSASHFSRRFRSHFGYSPFKLRLAEQAS